MRSIDKAGLEGLDAELAFTVLEPLQPPNPTTPEDGVVLNTATPWIAWSRVPDANHYVLQVAGDREFKKEIQEFTHLMNSYYRYSEALPAGDYYWRVLSISTNQTESPFSVVRRFSVGTAN